MHSQASTLCRTLQRVRRRVRWTSQVCSSGSRKRAKASLSRRQSESGARNSLSWRCCGQAQHNSAGRSSIDDSWSARSSAGLFCGSPRATNGAAGRWGGGLAASPERRRARCKPDCGPNLAPLRRGAFSAPRAVRGLIRDSVRGPIERLSTSRAVRDARETPPPPKFLR